MSFADLKNDFIFRRIFAKHPDILRGLLNDLLERTGDSTITSIEYLPLEQLPLVMGARLSLLDVRCKDLAGTTFVVAIQLMHLEGFINRVVFNACEDYESQLKARAEHKPSADVVAISICEFELWPDNKQVEQKLPLVPMLSRWHMTERSLVSHELVQVEYAFVELPKLPKEKPAAGAGYWAWLFVHAPELTEMPADLPEGPHRAALELANEATFTPGECDAYERVIAEIGQVRELAEAKWAEGARSVELNGALKAKRDVVLRLLMHAQILLTDDERARIQVCADPTTLDRWMDATLDLLFGNALGAKSAADVLT